MTPEELHVRREEILTQSKALVEKCKRLCAESRLIVAHAKEACHLTEDVRKRCAGYRYALTLARGNKGYVLKKCTCGRTYFVKDWFKLQFAGYQDSTLVGGELRHCECKSTLLFITRREAA